MQKVALLKPLSKGSISIAIKKVITDKIKWIPLPNNVIKLDFDWASKGNLGPLRVGGFIRNSEGVILSTIYKKVSVGSNNKA